MYFSFPMEIHLVHKKTDYASVGASIGYNDGLAVIGIMFQVADTSDDGLKVRLIFDILNYKLVLEHFFVFKIISFPYINHYLQFGFFLSQQVSKKIVKQDFLNAKTIRN